jgi:peptidoglycan/LPS O-acetylase OafA/YrhL
LSWLAWFGSVMGQAVPYHAYHVVESVLCFLLVTLVTMAPATYTRRLLSSGLMRRMGVLSYSVYMLHIPVVQYGLHLLRSAEIPQLFGWNWRTGLVTLGMWTVCFGLAECTYRCIERPFLVRKERVGA